jgi:hypothetical protein
MAGRSAIMPAIVGQGDLLADANALNQVRWQVASLLGPALAGWMLSTWRPDLVLLVDAATFLLFALVLTRIPPAADEVAGSGASYWTLFREGLRWMVRSRPLLALTVHSFLFNLVYGPLRSHSPSMRGAYWALGPPGWGRSGLPLPSAAW